MSKPSAWWVAIIASGVVTGCNEDGGEPWANGIQHPACEGLTTTLTLQDRMGQSAYVFNVGEDIFANMRVTNNGSYPVMMDWAGSCSGMVWEITRQTTTVARGSSYGVMCFMAPPPVVYAPYESVDYKLQLGGASIRTWPPEWSWPWPSGGYMLDVEVGFPRDSQGQHVGCYSMLNQQASFAIF